MAPSVVVTEHSETDHCTRVGRNTEPHLQGLRPSPRNKWDPSAPSGTWECPRASHHMSTGQRAWPTAYRMRYSLKHLACTPFWHFSPRVLVCDWQRAHRVLLSWSTTQCPIMSKWLLVSSCRPRRPCEAVSALLSRYTRTTWESHMPLPGPWCPRHCTWTPRSCTTAPGARASGVAIHAGDEGSDLGKAVTPVQVAIICKVQVEDKLEPVPVAGVSHEMVMKVSQNILLLGQET